VRLSCRVNHHPAATDLSHPDCRAALIQIVAPHTRFTAKQGQYLAFIWAYTQINRRAPAEADFQQYFDVTAPSVHQMLKTLDQLGLIQKQARVPRSIQLLVEPQHLPTLGVG
jgi:DNA-binding MarR family transcriptional regulator